MKRVYLFAGFVMFSYSICANVYEVRTKAIEYDILQDDGVTPKLSIVTAIIVVLCAYLTHVLDRTTTS